MTTNGEQEVRTGKNKSQVYKINSDLVIIGIAVILVFVLSFYFNIFQFIVILFQKNPVVLGWIDEIITCLLTLSIGLAIFAWRRLKEYRQEAEKCIMAEKELANYANTKAEAERIVSKQLHAEIEILLKYLKEEREILLSKIQKNR